jgi:hypothetical protein
MFDVASGVGQQRSAVLGGSPYLLGSLVSVRCTWVAQKDIWPFGAEKEEALVNRVIPD